MSATSPPTALGRHIDTGLRLIYNTPRIRLVIIGVIAIILWRMWVAKTKKQGFVSYDAPRPLKYFEEKSHWVGQAKPCTPECCPDAISGEGCCVCGGQQWVKDQMMVVRPKPVQ